MKKKFKLPSWRTVLGLFLGIALGILLAMQMVRSIPTGLSTFQELGTLWLMLLLLYLTMFLQILFHEAGHLVFGLLTGYRFVSFRIFCFQLSMVEGRIKLGRHSVAGTGGQCLMAPPKLADGKMPFLLYNLGGSLMNLLTAAIFALLLLFGEKTGVFSFFCLSMAEIGLFFALTNGIPMGVGGIKNDGSNALAAAKNPEALKAFWLQLRINEEMSLGKRLKDMPEEWFAVPSGEDMGDHLTETIAAFACNRLVDQGRYAEARDLIGQLLSGDNKITGIYGNLLACDLLCCELVCESRPEIAAKLYTEELRGFMKSMKTSPSIIRTQYIYALLAERDQKQASACQEKFEKIAKNYPYPGDLMADRELMAFALEKTKSEAEYHG